MKIFFWENIISHLRTPFLKALISHGDLDITLVVDKELTEARKKLGWKPIKIEGLKLLVNPDKEEVKNVIKENKTALHFISGLNVYEVPTLALKELKRQKIKFYLMSEQFNKTGFKGKLRKLKSKIDYFKYSKYINGIYAIGDDAYKWYLDAGFDQSKVFQWIYFSEKFNLTLPDQKNQTLLFVGELSDRKNILYLIDNFLKLNTNNYKLKIIGAGEHQNKVEQLSKQHQNKVEYLGVMSSKQVRQNMLDSKILILPSLFDGWGAVVNEALLCGNYCITSDNCGSKTLFRKSPFLGTTFKLNKKDDLSIVLNKSLKKADKLDFNLIAGWSEEHLNHEKAVNYFIETINFSNKINKIKPQAPWL